MVANSTASVISISDYQLVGVLILTIAIIGLTGNLVVAIFTRRLPTMNNPFGKLMASQATGEAILCSVFAFYFSPMVFMQNEWMMQNSKHAGWINLIAYDICIWSHFFIALNRLCAICFPLQYESIFKRNNIRIVIATSWIIPMLTAIVLYKFYDCDLYYSNEYFAFVFTQNEVCKFISWNIDFYKDISIVLVIAVLDLTTIFMAHITAKKIALADINLRRRRKRELSFLKQAVLQGIVFVVELLTYFYFAWKTDKRMVTFALTTVAWNMVHMTDSIIIITFNQEFRRLMLRPLQKIRNARRFVRKNVVIVDDMAEGASSHVISGLTNTRSSHSLAIHAARPNRDSWN